MSHNILNKITIISSLASALTLSTTVMAEDYNNPYPGKLSAQLINVVSAATIDVEAETWPGYSKAFRVSLANIQVPQSTSEKACQRKLAEQALNFTKDFLTANSAMSISDLKIANSSAQTATAEISTNQGSLTDALKSHGFARSSTTNTDEPWC